MKHLFNILIVDDEPLNRLLLEKILGSAGYGILTAKSGAEALQVLQVILPDLILLDIMMPGMDGIQVLAKIKSNTMTCSIPVIMVTAFDNIKNKEESIKNGAFTYITKPITKKIILQVVQDVLDKKSIVVHRY